jgi:hypothetical protein
VALAVSKNRDSRGMQETGPTLPELIYDWRDARRAADLTERLSKAAADAVDRADEAAAGAEEVAALAEAVAIASERAAKTARAAADRASALAGDLRAAAGPPARAVPRAGATATLDSHDVPSR